MIEILIPVLFIIAFLLIIVLASASIKLSKRVDYLDYESAKFVGAIGHNGDKIRGLKEFITNIEDSNIIDQIHNIAIRSGLRDNIIDITNRLNSLADVLGYIYSAKEEKVPNKKIVFKYRKKPRGKK